MQLSRATKVARGVAERVAALDGPGATPAGAGVCSLRLGSGGVDRSAGAAGGAAPLPLAPLAALFWWV